jgi:hypothetical protein
MSRIFELFAVSLRYKGGYILVFIVLHIYVEVVLFSCQRMREGDNLWFDLQMTLIEVELQKD